MVRHKVDYAVWHEVRKEISYKLNGWIWSYVIKQLWDQEETVKTLIQAQTYVSRY